MNSMFSVIVNGGWGTEAIPIVSMILTFRFGAITQVRHRQARASSTFGSLYVTFGERCGLYDVSGLLL